MGWYIPYWDDNDNDCILAVPGGTCTTYDNGILYAYQKKDRWDRGVYTLQGLGLNQNDSVDRWIDR